jgi:single-strand DNA-binding protein
MSRSLNKVMIIGNVGKDPEINYTGSGIPIAKMGVATTETWKDKDGLWQEHTDWHNIVAWRGLAETIHKIVHKGDAYLY